MLKKGKTHCGEPSGLIQIRDCGANAEIQRDLTAAWVKNKPRAAAGGEAEKSARLRHRPRGKWWDSRRTVTASAASTLSVGPRSLAITLRKALFEVRCRICIKLEAAQ